MNDFFGVQSGFGVPVGRQTMDELTKRGFGTFRVGVHPLINSMPLIEARDLLLQSIAEVQSYGATPLVLVPPRTIVESMSITIPGWVPDGLDVELYGVLPLMPGSGLEPDLLGLSPEAVALEIDTIMPVCRSRRHRVWAPCISNFSKPALAWTKAFVAALKSPDVGIAIHRYMDYGTNTSKKGRKDFRDRNDEINQFVAAFQGRPWWVTETNWTAGRHMNFQGDVYKGLDAFFRVLEKFKIPNPFSFVLTENDCAQNFFEDCKLYHAAGARGVVWYQVNDAQGDGESGQGLRRYPYELNSWRSAANVPLRVW